MSEKAKAKIIAQLKRLVNLPEWSEVEKDFLFSNLRDDLHQFVNNVNYAGDYNFKCPECGGDIICRSAIDQCEDCDYWYPTV